MNFILFLRSFIKFLYLEVLGNSPEVLLKKRRRSGAAFLLSYAFQWAPVTGVGEGKHQVQVVSRALRTVLYSRESWQSEAEGGLGSGDHLTW